MKHIIESIKDPTSFVDPYRRVPWYKNHEKGDTVIALLHTQNLQSLYQCKSKSPIKKSCK